MSMNTTHTPGLNLPKAKKKGLVKLFGGISAPFYFTTSVVLEGTPMKFDLGVAGKVDPAVAGATNGPLVIGLALQETYDEAALGQLKGYHFANDTRQRLNGLPIGILMGSGWAGTHQYSGTVAWGQQAAIGASGKLIDGSAAPSGDKLPVYFESGGVDGKTLVRIRYDFPVAK